VTGLEAWGAVVIGPMPGGARSRLWRVEVGGVPCVARRVAVGEPSLCWLARLQAVAVAQGLRLAPLIPASNGALTVGGWTVEPWLEGQPGTAADLPEVRRALRRMHRATRGWPARPGLVPRLPLRLPVATGKVAAVHGDVHPGNVLRLAGGGLALIDWEEARIGDTRLDLGFSRDAAGRAAHAAAEVAACWRVEPERARIMARRLRLFRT
jgi:Ser/Thr protein kinase RdoA (MazF antagonist)